jgi:hypothetical protein
MEKTGILGLIGRRASAFFCTTHQLEDAQESNHAIHDMGTDK